MRKVTGIITENKIKINNKSSKFQRVYFYIITVVSVGFGWTAKEDLTQNEQILLNVSISLEYRYQAVISFLFKRFS